MTPYFNFDLFEEDFLNDNFFSEFENHFKDMVKRIFQEEREVILEPEQLQEEETDAAVIFVPPNYLPHGRFWKALGVYVPYTHTIYIANNLPPRVKKFVYYHEVAHSLGIMDEREADMFATQKCGYFINLRKPRGFVVRY